jgi:hypothetical protein
MATALLTNKLLTLGNNKSNQAFVIDPLVFGQKVNLVTKLFGCWHKNISRPFIQGETSYRSCLQCGARKQFNPETLETFGSFYFPPLVRKVLI